MSTMTAARPAPEMRADDLASAAAAARDLRDKRRALERQIEGITAAFTLSRASKAEEARMSPALKAAAQPYRDDADRRPHTLRTLRDKLREDLGELGPAVAAANEARARALRIEAGRIAESLRPQHRLAVSKLIAAVEAASAAIAEERAVRAEYQRLAPVGAVPFVTSPLPDLSTPLKLGLIGETGSNAQAWANEIRASGYTK